MVKEIGLARIWDCGLLKYEWIKPDVTHQAFVIVSKLNFKYLGQDDSAFVALAGH